MKIKRWAKVLMIAAGGVLLLILLFVALQQQREILCSDIVVVLEPHTAGVSVDEEAVIQHLKDYSDTIRGLKLKEIDLPGLHRHLIRLPYISDVDLYFTLHGVLKAKVFPRGIITRVYDIHGSSLLLADDGLLLPVPPHGGPRVPVASGMILDTLRMLRGKSVHSLPKESVIHEIYKTAMFLSSDPFYKSLIAQIYVRDDKDLELVPTIDDHIILIGNADNLDYKFEKLMAFYRKGTVRTGWNAYRKINIKHSNQVICTNR